MSHAEKILNIIKENPGIASFDIRKLYFPDQGHDRCVIAHQLTRLWRRGFVDRQRVTTRRAKTYTYTIAKEDMTNVDKVLTIIQRNPGLNAKQIGEISERNSLPASNIPSIITVLVNRGKLTRRKFFPENGHPHYQYWASEDQTIEQVAPTPEIRQEKTTLSATQAADFIGVSLPTLYGYSSLSWFSSNGKDSGERCYLVEDLERLKKYICEKTEKKPKIEVELNSDSHGLTVDDEKFSIPALVRDDQFKLAIKMAVLVCLHEASMACNDAAMAALDCAAKRIDRLVK